MLAVCGAIIVNPDSVYPGACVLHIVYELIRFLMPVLRGCLVPGVGIGFTLLDTVSFQIHITELLLGVHMALLSGFFEPGESHLRILLGYPEALGIHDSQLELQHYLLLQPFDLRSASL